MNLYLEIYNWKTTKRKFIVPFAKRFLYYGNLVNIPGYINTFNKYSYSETIELLLYFKFPYIGIKI